MLVAEIESKMKEALRAGNKMLKEDYAYLLSLFRAKEVELRHPLSDRDAIGIIQKEVKSLSKDFDTLSGNQLKTHYAQALKRQIDLYSSYLPKMMSYDEIMAYIAGLDADCELPTSFGAAMKMLRASLNGKAEGKILSQALKDYMSKENK